MFHLYSKGCEYALRAMIYIGVNQGSKKKSAKQICMETGIPVSFTRKYLQLLARKKLLKAVPGVNGGYELAYPAHEITVKSIIIAVEGGETFARCIMGLPECNEKVPCPLHQSWSQVKGSLISVLDSKTLNDLIEVVKKRERKAVSDGDSTAIF